MPARVINLLRQIHEQTGKPSTGYVLREGARPSRSMPLDGPRRLCKARSDAGRRPERVVGDVFAVAEARPARDDLEDLTDLRLVGGVARPGEEGDGDIGLGRGQPDPVERRGVVEAPQEAPVVEQLDAARLVLGAGVAVQVERLPATVRWAEARNWRRPFARSPPNIAAHHAVLQSKSFVPRATYHLLRTFKKSGQQINHVV